MDARELSLPVCELLSNVLLSNNSIGFLIKLLLKINYEAWCL